MNSNKVLALIGSKWFVLILAIAMIVVVPITYGNLMIVYNAGEMSRLWWVPTVFIINVLAAFMSIYKVMGMFFQKKEVQAEWDE